MLAAEKSILHIIILYSILLGLSYTHTHIQLTFQQTFTISIFHILYIFTSIINLIQHPSIFFERRMIYDSGFIFFENPKNILNLKA